MNEELTVEQRRDILTTLAMLYADQYGLEVKSITFTPKEQETKEPA